jgi:fibronectin type 3 domain-containing protein
MFDLCSMRARSGEAHRTARRGDFVRLAYGAILAGAAVCATPHSAVAQTFPTQIGVEADCRGHGPFVDLAKTLRPFTIIGGGGNAPVDSSEWPTTDAETVLMDERPVPAWAPPIDDPAGYQPDESGTYNCSFIGQATLAPALGSPITIANQVYNSGTNTTTFTFTLPAGDWQTAPALICIDFTNTKRTAASATNTGITNLKCIRPGYPANTAQVFTDPFISAFAPFNHVRFMGWKDTNYTAGYYGDAGHHLINWADRGLPSDATQDTNQSFRAGCIGMAWEYVILLANQINKDVWINIPVSATGASTTDTTSYLYKLAQLFKNGDTVGGTVYPGLNPGLHIYIEHSNEVWNFSFSQYTWNKLAGVDEVGIGGSPLNNDGNTNQDTWAHRRHGKRLREIAKIFEAVYGAGSLNTTIRPVYASWVINAQSHYTDVLNWMNTTYGAPNTYFYAIAGTSYFGETPTAGESVATILSRMSGTGSLSLTQQLKAVATTWGVKYYAYEAGPDNGGGSTVNIGNRILANRDPGMTNCILNDVRTNFFGQGHGDLYNYFTLSSAFSRYGCWGASDDITQRSGPKWQAIYNLTGYTPGSAPAAPTNLTASGGNTQVTLNWTGSAGATSYKVYRATTAGGEGTTPIASGITGTTYTNTGLTNGTTYYFKVAAVNVNGTGSQSGEASAVPNISAPAAPTGLSAAAGNTQISLTWSASSGATSYSVYRGTAAGGESTTAIASGLASPAYTNTGLTNGTTYFYKVKATNANGTSGYSNEASATPVANTLPSPWVDTDIGAVGVAGSGSYASPTFTVKGSGADIWGASDAFNYVNQPLSGDITVIARVASVQNTDLWAKSGVMIRESTAANSAFADMLITPGNGASFQWRGTTGGTAISVTTAGIAAPYWVKLVRTGNSFSGYISSTGSTWTQVGTTQTITMAAGVKAGLCDCAHNNTALCTTTFDNVSATGVTVPAAPAGLTASPGNGQITLNWNASSGATSYTVNYTTGGNYAPAGTTATTSFTHTGLTNGTTYTYYVTASNSAGTSGPSNNANATPIAGGTGTGLKGEYYNTKDLSGALALSRTDATVDFNWALASPGTGVNTDGWSARWSGQVQAPVTGSYTFSTTSDDGVRLWVNGALVINNWTDHASAVNNSAAIALTAGVKYDIHMEYYDSTSNAVAKLHWSYPGQSDVAIPTSQLYTNEALATIATTATAPTIDGTVDTVWGNAPSYNVANVAFGTISSAADLTSGYKALWDATNLYVLVDVTDDVKTNDSTSVYDDDCIEFFVDGNNSKGTIYDGANDIQWAFGWGDAAVVEGAGPAGRTTGITFAKVDPTTTSYRLEIKIPWSTIGVTPAANALVGLDVHVNDDDDGALREGMKAWWDATNNAWQNPSVFGTGKLK